MHTIGVKISMGRVFVNLAHKPFSVILLFLFSALNNNYLKLGFIIAYLLKGNVILKQKCLSEDNQRDHDSMRLDHLAS